ncbi:Uncharacterised protein [Orientia tsutsugamushi]|nr:Uncharacterised protein [Orientia tsutsugamushi]
MSNKWILIKTIFNISHNHNCALSLADLLYYAFHTFPYPNLASLMILTMFETRCYLAILTKIWHFLPNETVIT